MTTRHQQRNLWGKESHCSRVFLKSGGKLCRRKQVREQNVNALERRHRMTWYTCSTQ